jgi:hypothetical protein
MYSKIVAALEDALPPVSNKRPSDIFCAKIDPQSGECSVIITKRVSTSLGAKLVERPTGRSMLLVEGEIPVAGIPVAGISRGSLAALGLFDHIYVANLYHKLQPFEQLTHQRMELMLAKADADPSSLRQGVEEAMQKLTFHVSEQSGLSSGASYLLAKELSRMTALHKMLALNEAARGLRPEEQNAQEMLKLAFSLRIEGVSGLKGVVFDQEHARIEFTHAPHDLTEPFLEIPADPAAFAVALDTPDSWKEFLPVEDYLDFAYEPDSAQEAVQERTPAQKVEDMLTRIEISNQDCDTDFCDGPR